MPKYVVIKEEEYKTWIKQSPALVVPPPVPIEGAAVIRYQDVFSASVLHSYANAVQTAIEILNVTGGSPQVMGQLVETRDDFHGMAMEAQSYPTKKLPD